VYNEIMYKRLNTEEEEKEEEDEKKTSLDESKIDQDEDNLKENSSLLLDTDPVLDKSDVQFYIPCCGLILYTMTFLGICCAFSLRVSVSEAIVAAVNTTAVAKDLATNASADDQCPRDPELQLLNGEFVWSRYQQGMVLAAFYYGRGFTQVCTAIPIFI